MDIIEKFESLADECRRMARFTHDHDSRAVWTRMADRWVTLAENEKGRRPQFHQSRAARGRTAHRSHAA
jgi:hypothetical protein